MRRYGGPAGRTGEDAARVRRKSDEIRLRSIASAVNHSELKIRAGVYPIRRNPPFPYVPGLEVVGDAVEIGSAVREFSVGDRAITMMQGTGGLRAKRDGGYAEFVVMPTAVAASVPADLDPLEVAALGLASVTALGGLHKLGDLEGRRIAITGASGGVGSAAIGIARAKGAQVIGIVSRAERADYVRSLGADEVRIASEVESGALGEETIDGVLDTVAGALFSPCVNALHDGAILSVVGAVGGGEVTFDAYHLLNVTLTGYSSETLDGVSLRAAMAKICQWLRAGKLKPPARINLPLHEASRAHAALEARGIEGRVLLVSGRA